MSSSDATMSSPLFVPSSLQFYVNRLSFSKNRVRLQALSTEVATPGSQVIVRLPSNTMINLASLTMTGGVRATINNPALIEGVALPTNYDFSFIETLSLIANGGIITQPFINYKLLGNTLNDVYGSDSKNAARSALQGSIPAPLRESQPGYQPFSINNWISATQTMAPSYLSTNLLGDLELRLTMTDTSILQTGRLDDGLEIIGLGARCTWDMNNINFYVETASIESSMLDQAIAAKLAGGEPINVPFENVFSFSQQNGGPSFNQRFSVSSQSVNKILAVTQLQGDISGEKKFVNGVPEALRRNSNGAVFSQFSVNNQYSPNYQIDSNIINGTDLSLISLSDGTAFDPVRDSPPLVNYQASNVLVETRAAMDIPDYDYECGDKLCSTTQLPFEFLGGGLKIVGGLAGQVQPASAAIVLQTGQFGVNPSSFWTPYVYKPGIRTFLEEKYLLATSFDLDVSDKDRLVSGINTLGSNAQMFLNVVGAVGNNSSVSTIFVLCTSMIQIYQGATLQIIQ
jgi:hypothetical protein